MPCGPPSSGRGCWPSLPSPDRAPHLGHRRRRRHRHHPSTNADASTNTFVAGLSAARRTGNGWGPARQTPAHRSTSVDPTWDGAPCSWPVSTAPRPTQRFGSDRPAPDRLLVQSCARFLPSMSVDPISAGTGRATRRATRATWKPIRERMRNRGKQSHPLHEGGEQKRGREQKPWAPGVEHRSAGRANPLRPPRQPAAVRLVFSCAHLVPSAVADPIGLRSERSKSHLATNTASPGRQIPLRAASELAARRLVL